MVNTIVHRGREGRNGISKAGGLDLRMESKCLEGEGIILGKNFRPSTERFREPAIGRGCRSKPGGKGSADGGQEWKCKEGGRDRRWEIRVWREGAALWVNTFVHRGREGSNGMRKAAGRDLLMESKCLEGEALDGASIVIGITRTGTHPPDPRSDAVNAIALGVQYMISGPCPPIILDLKRTCRCCGSAWDTKTTCWCRRHARIRAWLGAA